MIFRQLLSLFETPRTFQSASNVYSADPGRFYKLLSRVSMEHAEEGLPNCKKVYQDYIPFIPIFPYMYLFNRVAGKGPKSQKFNQINICQICLFSEAHVPQEREVSLNNHTALHLFRCQTSSFLSHNISSDAEHPFTLAARNWNREDDPHH